MEPVTLRHKQGKLIVTDDALTIERVGFPRPAPQVIPFAQITAIRSTIAFPAAFGKGGAMSMTLHIVNAPAIDLELVSPLSAAQQVVSAIQNQIAERPAAPAVVVAPEVLAPVSDAPQAVVAQAVAPQAVAPAIREQLVKIYRGANCTRQFEKDYKKLAAQGWQIQSQSYGGQTSKAGAVLMFGVLGLAAGTRPREMTVIYVRN